MNPVRYSGGTPHRAVQNQAFCRTGRPRRTVRYRKRPCGVRESFLSAGGRTGSRRSCRNAWTPGTRANRSPMSGLSSRWASAATRWPAGPSPNTAVSLASRWPAGARSCSISPHMPQTPQTPQTPQSPVLPSWCGKRVFAVPKASRKHICIGSGKAGVAVRIPC